MFTRYALTGGAATGTHYLVLMLLVHVVNVAPAFAAVTGAASGSLVAYAGNRRFTFQSDADHRRALPRFLFIAAIGATVSGTLVWIVTKVMAGHYLVGQVIATACVLGLTYPLNRDWTFK